MIFVDSTLGYRITLTQHNTDTAFLCMVFGLFALNRVSDFREVCPIKTESESSSNRALNKGFSLDQAHEHYCFGDVSPCNFTARFLPGIPIDEFMLSLFCTALVFQLSHIQCKKSIYPVVDINRCLKMTECLIAFLHSYLEICSVLPYVDSSTGN